MSSNHRTRGRQRGQGTVEYSLLLALVAALVIGGMVALSPVIGASYNAINSVIDSAIGIDNGGGNAPGPTNTPPTSDWITTIGYYTTTGNGANGSSTGFCRYAVPQASVSLGPNQGTISQFVSDGSLTLSVTGATGYADTGFYVPLGTLGSLAGTGYSLSANGPVATNLYFDSNHDGQFFAWGDNDCWTGPGGDLYGLGPSGTGTVAVTDSSTFNMMSPSSGTYTVAELASGTAVAGVDANTPVAVWVGMTLGNGGSASVTFTSVP